MNKFIVAAAGSGKTTYIVKEALKIKNGRILITTFTDANKEEIEKKFYEYGGKIPKNVTIQTWFSFLLRHGVKPYQGVIYEGNISNVLLVNERSGLKYITKSGFPVYFGEEDVEKHYLSTNNFIYTDKLAKFVIKANEKSNNSVIERLERIFAHIFIDEIQDMAGYDLEIIKLLFESKSNILLVGDPRQVTYHTHYEPKHEKYLDGKIINFINNNCKKSKVEIDEDFLNISYRNNEGICKFANSIFPNLKPCFSGNNKVTGHDGVFYISSQEVDAYLNKFKPVQLRDSIKTKVNERFPVMNMGESKGLTFDRVLIYPTQPIKDWIKNNKNELKFKSQCKFYVAVTRARYSVAIIMDNPKHMTFIGLEEYKM